MADKKTILTYAGLKKLEEELENLKVVKRKEVAGKIKEAGRFVGKRRVRCSKRRTA